MEPVSPDVIESDERLLERASGGDYDAFQRLVERFQTRVLGLAIRILGQRQDAEDVTQQTFVSVIEHMDGFRGDSSAATWILRIATNHALKILRKRRGLHTVSWDAPDPDDTYESVPHPDFIASWSAPPDELAQRAEVREQIDQALASLDDKYRLVFILRDIEGLSVRETAESLGLTEGTVKVRLLRARLMLRECLTRSFGDPETRLYPTHDHG
jgi:RNA polymerase sigma-70 factor (ECF subfamily)